MKYRKAKKTRDNAIVSATFSGHDPMLLVHSGAMELWVCKNCDALLDAWDRPAIVNGPMPYTRCPEARRSKLHSVALGTLLIISSCFRRWVNRPVREGHGAL
jgi:hypothetical protein